MRCQVFAGKFLSFRNFRCGHAAGKFGSPLSGFAAIRCGNVEPHVGLWKILHANIELAQHHRRFFMPTGRSRFIELGRLAKVLRYAVTTFNIVAS
jgi:hypothetical protein